MANEEPTKQDTDKLDKMIKELAKRHDSLDATAGELHDAAAEVKSVSAAKAKELDDINKKGAAADKSAAKNRK